MTQFTYLFVDFFTMIIPLLFSFHPKLNFYKTWWAFFPAVIFSALCFLIWDGWFTSLGVWGFNQQYLTGIMIGNLPIEELLFFACIPYACVFTFHSLNVLVSWKVSEKIQDRITGLLIIGLTIASFVFWGRMYTSFTFLSQVILLLMARYWLRVKWLGKFYITYALLLLPFLVVNGILTGTGLENPVVWYSSKEIIGVRLLTIPLEDIFYGMALVLLNLLIYQHLLNRKAATQKLLPKEVI